MPRLIPRLLKAPFKGHQNTRERIVTPTRTRASQPSSVPTSTVPTHHGRKRSVLLDDVNPITNGAAYRRRKTRDPRVIASGTHVAESAETQQDDESSHELRRVMSEEERRWWANPYLRMLASPMRRCIVTNTVQPADFMVRIAAMSVPTGHSSGYTTALFPDGVEHPRYRGKRAGNGRWVLCYKDTVEHIIESKPIQRRYLNANLPADSLLAQHVGSVLRTRVIQELEILGEQLRCKPIHSQEVPVLRRLRRSELRQIKQDGILSLEGAVAVIIIPPLNKNPASKERPEPSTSAPPTISSSRDGTKTNKYPIAELYPVEHQQNSWAEGDSLTSMTSAKVPLYNGVSLFPESSQRTAFYQVLQNIMRIEKQARHRQSSSTTKCSGTASRNDVDREDQKESHAYVLYSTSATLERADSVPLAIALWRLRMWEGGGWNNDQNGTGIYMRNPPWFDRNADPGRRAVKIT